MKRHFFLLSAASSAIAIACFVVLARPDPTRAGFAYLTAFTYVFTVAVGALYWIMIGHATNAVWFVALRRTAEQVVAVMPVLALAFVPIPVLWSRSFGWTDVPENASAALSGFTSASFVAARAVVYWLVLCGFSFALRRESLAQDRAPAATHVYRQRRVGSAGLAIVGLTFSFACFDWLMPLTHEWYSTMYGVYLSAGAAIAGLALVAVLAELGRRAHRLPDEVGASHFEAIGKLFLVTTMFWAYIAFCQLLLIWIADIPAESQFYEDRVNGRWTFVSAALGLAQFGLPFLCLLSWKFKRSPRRVAVLGAWLLLAHYADVYWLVVPSRDPNGPRFDWIDVAAFFAVAAPCVSYAVFRARRAPSIPVNDPHLSRSLEFESA